MIDNTVDNTTGTIRLKATFDNQDRMLWPGQFVNVALTLDTLKNVTGDSGRSGAGRAAGAVRLRSEGGQGHRDPHGDGGARPSDNKVVIEKGVAPGETVVTDGQLLLFPGAHVRPVAVRASRSGSEAAMNISRIFIERPVMTALVTFAILLFGIVGYPRAAGGRAAERGLSHHSSECRRCRARIRRPWRRRWPRRSNASSPPSPAWTTMSSTNSQGTTAITVQFALSRNIDAAAQDIQAAIAKAGGQLPPNMPRPPSYQKVNPAEQPVLYHVAQLAHAAALHRG